MGLGRSVLRAEGSACPRCGKPIERRGSAADSNEIMMRCTGCGWFSCWHRSGTPRVDGSMDQIVSDMNWLAGNAAYLPPAGAGAAGFRRVDGCPILPFPGPRA